MECKIFPIFQDTKDSIYEKYDPLLHGRSRSKKDQVLSTKFMRKYIHIARLMKPKLTQEACDTIADEYAKLRNQDMMDSDVARVRALLSRRCIDIYVQILHTSQLYVL